MKHNKILRGGIIFLYYTIGYYLPNKEIPFIGEVSRRFRAFLCKQLFSHAGAWINIQSHVYFGTNNVINVGEGSGLGANFHLQNCNLTLEDQVMTGPNITILGGGHRFERTDIPIGVQGNYPKSNLTIGTGAWIGRGAYIMGKVQRIGKHAIVGAASVVTKDVPDYAIVAGNPAKIIRYRNRKNESSNSN